MGCFLLVFRLWLLLLFVCVLFLCLLVCGRFLCVFLCSSVFQCFLNHFLNFEITFSSRLSKKKLLNKVIEKGD